MTSSPYQSSMRMETARSESGLVANFAEERIHQIVERMSLTPMPDDPKPSLPIMTTANDLRELVQYLKKHPDGVTVVEAVSEIKKRLVDLRKLSACEFWGIIDRQGDVFQLSALGWQLAWQLTREGEIFRVLLQQIEPYRQMLEYAHSQQLKLITNEDVGRYWQAHFADAYDLRQSKIIAGNVLCFLHICHAAALGELTVGKRGQPARMRIDTDELEAFIKNSWEQKLDGNADHYSIGLLASSMTGANRQNERAIRICICVRSAREHLTAIQKILDLIGFVGEILERDDNSSGTMSEAAFDTMRRCEAGLFVVTMDDFVKDETGALILKSEVQAEISAAWLFYNRRVVLLWDERMPVPDAWQHMKICLYQGETLNLDTGLQLVKELLEFKR